MNNQLPATFDTVEGDAREAPGTRNVAADPPRWLIDGIWASGDRMVVGVDAEEAPLAVADLAISLAAGTPFLGVLSTGTPVPVAVCAGKVGRRSC